MSVATVNGHVLFSDKPSWNENPRIKRTWENHVLTSVTAAESRLAVRANPRHAITFEIIAGTAPELAILDDRIRAAKKSGKACAPYHGRGYTLQSDVTLATAVLDRSWNSAFGESVFFEDHTRLNEVRTVLLAESAVLTLDGNVTRNYQSGCMCWPVLFGKFDCETLNPLSGECARVRITISELTNSAAEQIGEIEAVSGTGIGSWLIGDNFTVQA